MPIYTYECEECGEYQKEQRITEEPDTVCELCRSKTRRLISGGTSFALRGSCWEKDGYS